MGTALPLKPLERLHPSFPTSPITHHPRTRIQIGAPLHLFPTRFVPMVSALALTVGLHGIETELQEGVQEEVHPVCGCDSVDVGGDAGGCGGHDAFSH